MATIPDVSEEELNALAADNPAVREGLVKCEVLAWYVPMRMDKKQSAP